MEHVFASPTGHGRSETSVYRSERLKEQAAIREQAIKQTQTVFILRFRLPASWLPFLSASRIVNSTFSDTTALSDIKKRIKLLPPRHRNFSSNPFNLYCRPARTSVDSLLTSATYLSACAFW
jgi:hypothetical protein